MTKFIRQGDFILQLIDKKDIPKDAKKAPELNNHIKEGEESGHYHYLNAGIISVTPQGDMYVETEQPTEVTHQEHVPLPLEGQSAYKVINEESFDYTDFIKRQVID